jgi:hypothetical protein
MCEPSYLDSLVPNKKVRAKLLTTLRAHMRLEKSEYNKIVLLGVACGRTTFLRILKNLFSESCSVVLEDRMPVKIPVDTDMLFVDHTDYGRNYTTSLDHVLNSLLLVVLGYDATIAPPYLRRMEGVLTVRLDETYTTWDNEGFDVAAAERDLERDLKRL